MKETKYINTQFFHIFMWELIFLWVFDNKQVRADITTFVLVPVWQNWVAGMYSTQSGQQSTATKNKATN